MDSYSSVAMDAKNTSIAAHVVGDIRPTMPEKNVDAYLNTPKITNKQVSVFIIDEQRHVRPVEPIRLEKVCFTEIKKPNPAITQQP